MFVKLYFLSQTYAVYVAGARIACVILAHAAGPVMFHGYFKSTCMYIVQTIQYEVFQELDIPLPADFDYYRNTFLKQC